MKKILILVAICLCMCGCGKKEEKKDYTELNKNISDLADRYLNEQDKLLSEMYKELAKSEKRGMELTQESIELSLTVVRDEIERYQNQESVSQSDYDLLLQNYDSLKFDIKSYYEFEMRYHQYLGETDFNNSENLQHDLAKAVEEFEQPILDLKSKIKDTNR